MALTLVLSLNISNYLLDKKKITPMSDFRLTPTSFHATEYRRFYLILRDEKFSNQFSI